MSFQKSVNVKNTPGIPGDFFDDSPRRCDAKVLNVYGGTANPTVGNAFTYKSASTDPLQVVVGGTAGFAGILVNGKELVRSNGLTAGLTVSENSIGTICSMGRIWVTVNSAANVGDGAQFENNTGKIYALASGGTVSAGYTKIDGAKFVEVNGGSATLAVLELN